MVIFALILLLPPKIARMDSLFYDGDYAQLIAFADTIEQSDSGLVLLEALKFKAFSYVALDSTDRAIETFKRLLNINPFFELDPVYTFPEAMKAFQAARTELNWSQPLPLDTINALVQFRENFSLKKKAMPYSLILPGLGDMKIGRKKRGRNLMIGFTLSALSWAVTEVGYRKAKASYMEAQDPDEIKSRYSTMDMWYKLRFISAVSTIGLYIYAQVTFW